MHGRRSSQKQIKDDGLRPQDAAALLERISVRARNARQLSRLIAEEFGEERSEEAKWLRAAFDYMLRFQHEEGSSAFVPMWGFDDGSNYPPRSNQVPDEMSSYWEEVAVSVKHPLPKARLSHLLTETVPKKAHIHGKAAAIAYVQSFPLLESKLDQLQALQSADRLCKKFNFKDVGLDLVAPLRELVSSVMEGEEQKPGVAIPALELLDAMDDEQVGALLITAREKYGGDAHNLEGVLAIQRRRASTDEERRALDAVRVRTWLFEAEKSDPLVRLMHLETAARLAEELGLKDLKREAVAHLQAINPKDVHLAHITSEVDLPEETVEEYFNLFVERETWNESFLTLVLYEPPTGTVEQNEASLEESAREALLHDLLPKVKLGGDKLPRFRASNDEERRDEKLAEQESIRLQVMTPLRAGALERICSRHGKPTRDEMESFMAELPGLRNEMDARLASDCFMRYWDEDLDAGAFLCLGLIERLVRNLALKSGRSLYRVQRQKRPGQYPGLGFLLRELRDSLDPSWHRFLWTFLASPAGFNYRNELFHGFIRKPSDGHVLLLLIAMTYLATLDTAAEAERDKGG